MKLSKTTALILTAALLTVFIAGCQNQADNATPSSVNSTTSNSSSKEESNTSSTTNDSSNTLSSTEESNTSSAGESSSNAISDDELSSYLSNAVANGYCGAEDGIAWVIDQNNTITFYGNGEIIDFLEADTSGEVIEYERGWMEYNPKKAVITSGVTNIGYYTFANCTSLESITIADTVTRIEGEAFSGCTSLKSITIPNNIVYIGNEAFSDWTSDQTINMKGKSSAPSDWNSDWKKDCDAKIVWNA